MHRPQAPAGRLVVLLALALVATACVSDAATPNNTASEPAAPPTTIPTDSVASGTVGDDPVITVLSSRPDMITGGDARILIENASSKATVRLNSEDVTAVFGRNDDGDLEGVVSGMALGSNALAVTDEQRTVATSLTNHPGRGPVFSGPQFEPLVCTTDEHGLGPAEDRWCSAPTRVFWTYVDQDGVLTRLTTDPATVSPAVIERDGDEVPLIIRNEVGTINRGVYWIHTLDPDPLIDGLDRPWTGEPVWSGTLVMAYGGGCGATHGQGSPGPLAPSPADSGGPVDLDLLRSGHAVVQSTFTTFATHCNDVLAAETTMMLKERFIEGYGVPAVTVGSGTSGGAIQQLLVAQNYPGLLDGIVGALPFPDLVTVAPAVFDCQLLERYYATDSGAELTAEQRAAINGHSSPLTCGRLIETFGPAFSPSQGCAPGLASQAFDPVANPGGIRCTPWDLAPQLYAGQRRRVAAPFDNSGLQYGRQALEDGIISFEQFVELNESIGGLTIDGEPRPERSIAERSRVQRLYEQGRVNQAGGDLRRIPIILIDLYADGAGDVHDRFQVMAIRGRIDGGGSTPAPNVAVWTVETTATDPFDLTSYLAGEGGVLLDDLRQEAIEIVGAWAIDAAEAGGGSAAVALARTRPDAAADRCLRVDQEPVSGPEVNTAGGACGDLPVAGTPRTAAGADRDGFSIKCVKQPFDPTAYPGAPAADLLDRLETAYPRGVCDHTVRGAGHVSLGDTYQTY